MNTIDEKRMLSADENLALFETRKQDHIALALKNENEALGCSGLEQIQLIHNALPEIDFEQCDISSLCLGKPTKTPFFVSSMTAGHKNAQNINKVLLQACQQTGWAMGIGSQRRQLFDSQAAKEWQDIRHIAPDIQLFGNIGLAQLITSTPKQIQALIDSLHADGMIIHTNPLQECLQNEGTPHFQQGLDAITNLAYQINIPVIIKETGCGFSKATLEQLKHVGIQAVDISGFGGTHWGRIEGQRNEVNNSRAQAAISFANWGISTFDSLKHAIAIKPNYAVWASGGIRSGLDAAKTIAMNATMVGFAKPMLEAALQGVEAVIQRMTCIEYELKVALFCTGSINLTDLREKAVWQ